MRCIYKVLFIRVHPLSRKGECLGQVFTPLFAIRRLLQPSFLKAAANLRKKVETAKNPVPTYIGTKRR